MFEKKKRMGFCIDSAVMMLWGWGWGGGGMCVGIHVYRYVCWEGGDMGEGGVMHLCILMNNVGNKLILL